MALKIKRAPEKIDEENEVDNELDTTSTEAEAESGEIEAANEAEAD
jgi:hypothetical protein